MAPQDNKKDKKEKRELLPSTRVVTFNLHRALKGYVRGRHRQTRLLCS